MPPVLALLFCTVFVLFLLWLDHQQDPDVSIASWIPTLWMLVTASKPLGGWLLSTGGDLESGSPLDQLFQIACFSLGLLILAWRKFDWLRAVKQHPWVALLLIYMLFSIFWSDILFISFKRWVRELVAVVMAFLLLTERDPRQAMRSLFRRTVYVLIPFSLMLIKYFPLYGVEYGRWSGVQAWIGVTTQKNGLGRLCLISAYFLVWTFFRRWQGRDIPAGPYQTYAEAIVLLITLWLLIGGTGQYSASAIVALAVGLIAFVGLLWMKEQRLELDANTLTTVVSLMILFGTVTVFVGGSTIGTLTSTVGRDETLTGRTDVWAELLPVAMRNPVLGAGFGGFWTSSTRELYRISEGHSGYLDVLLDLGFIGLLLVSLFLLSSCRRAQRELDRDFDWALLWIGYLVMAVVHNMAESSLNTFTSHLTAVLLFLAVSSADLLSYDEERSGESSPLSSENVPGL